MIYYQNPPKFNVIYATRTARVRHASEFLHCLFEKCKNILIVHYLFEKCKNILTDRNLYVQTYVLSIDS